MIEVPATDFVRNFGRYRDAAQRQVVRVKTHDRVAGYFLSPDEFEEFQRLRAMKRRAYWVGELDDEMLEAIAASKVDSRHDHLNELLDD